MTGTTTETAVIGRVAVTWRPDAEPGLAGRERLARLGRRLADGALDAAFDTAFDAAFGSAVGAQICVRRVAPPVFRVRWDATDDELVDGWAGAVSRAVAIAVARGGADVVRYPSRTHARRELVTALLSGSRDRVWAWRQLGLWPAAGAPVADDVLRRALAEIGRTEPETAVGLLVSVAAAGLLGRLVAAVGAEAVAALVEDSWRAAGGAGGGLRAALTGLGPPAGAAAVNRGAAGTLDRDPDAEQAPRRLSPTVAAGPPPRTSAAARLTAHVRNRSVIAAAAPAVVGGVRSDALAVALAAAALLEVEPAAAAGTAAAATLRALAARPGQRGPSAAAAARPAHRDPPVAAGPACGGPSAAADALDASGAPPRTEPHASATARDPHRASTAWGGLLFLVLLVADVGLPERATADPDRYGPAVRTVLHGLARRLVARAVPDAGPAEPDDPAVLAFAGLAPTAEPPTDRVDPLLLDAEADRLVAVLRERLAPAPLAEAVERALLVAVGRRRAVIEADPGWIDVLLELDEVSVDVRRAGLDLDPGYLPWLGCVMRYRYG